MALNIVTRGTTREEAHTMSNTETTTETWKPVVEWEGFYEVSDQGNVRSVNRTIRYSDGRVKRHMGRVLRPGTSKTGRDRYLRVGLCRGSAMSMYKVHILVATAFHGPRPNVGVCRHLNDDVNDNRATNLAWGTSSDNQQDSVRNGHHAMTKKVVCLRSHELVEPNLTGEREGHRDCRSCRQARKSLNRRFGGYTEAQVKALSDEKYEKIMQRR